ISKGIRQLFSNPDISGRIGGDEFMVFLKNPESKEQVIHKAKEICKFFRKTYTGENRDYKISGSIGVAICPTDGTTYHELFRKADVALYEAKNKGKDRYEIFDPHANYNYCNDHDVCDITERTQITPIKQNMFLEHIEKYILEILFEAKDVETAINIILDRVGRHFGVTRAYIFENSSEGKNCINTFEWCNEGAKSEIKDIPKTPLSELETYFELFDHNGVFYCEDIKIIKKTNSDMYKRLKSQGVKSILQCFVLNNGELKGYVGFDECNENRKWTKSEIESLLIIAKTVSAYLVKMRIAEQFEKEKARLSCIIDNQKDWIFVLKAQTYEILYANSKVMNSCASAEIGENGFELLKQLKKSYKRKVVTQILLNQKDDYHHEYYDVEKDDWFEITSIKIDWEGTKDANLFLINDTTKNKDREKTEYIYF
ncbi:MAG: Two-component sensor histidine kinase, partial [Oscillospiraceae bacterium]|nr:Two-component sensor histidine kinase [Oscillospiraceae bacterium]